jgi:hypothetical protein
MSSRQKVKLFFTPSAQHTILYIDGAKETHTPKTFNDGEKYMLIEKINGPVWIRSR